jgi:glycosyltransferase involved in cell wall biosynthesis
LKPLARVLIIVENLPVPFDRRVWHESVSLAQAGYQVSVICPTGGEHTLTYEKLDGVSIYRYPAPRPTKSHLSYFWEFIYCWMQTAKLSFAVWRREGIDIIQACNPPDTFFLLGGIYKLFGKRFVYDQHDLCPEVYLARFEEKPNTYYRGLQLLEKLTYKTADMVFATNESYKRMAMERGKVPDDQVVVVRSAPDLRRFKPTPPDPSLRNGHRYLVSYLGVMAPQDGVDLFLKAIDYLVHEKERRDVGFILVGSGDSFHDLKEMSTALGLDDFVTFTGRVPDEAVERTISSSDVCVSPDPKNLLNDHSTMNKILEYMALSKPIVAFDLKETRYSAGDGALYATPNDPTDFGDKILELLADEELRAAMGRRNRQRMADHLDWSHSEKALLTGYGRLVDRFFSKAPRIIHERGARHT